MNPQPKLMVLHHHLKMAQKVIIARPQQVVLMLLRLEQFPHQNDLQPYARFELNEDNSNVMF